ncbi:MAG: response regulator transcription factor [Solirubrobacteraceae bacterium]
MSLGVVIADDQALVRAGFRMILETDPELGVLAEVSTGEQALDVTRRLRPDVVLMDIRMPEMNGLEATRRIARLSAAPAVLILTTFDLDEHAFDALRPAASGFVLEDVVPESLIAAVHTVAAGEALLAPSVTRRPIQAYTRDHRPTSPPAGIDELTPRELEILTLVARGMSNAEIADRLVVSAATIKTLGRVLEKLELRDRIQAVVLAYETGIVRPGAAAEP